MRTIPILIALVVLAPCPKARADAMAQARVLTLDQCLKMAFDDSPELVKARSNRTIGSAGLQSSASSLLPRLSASSSYTQSGPAGYGIDAVTQPVGLLLVTLVFWGLFAMLGGRATFAGMFAASAWAGMIAIPGSLVKVPLMFAQETVKVQTSLALILPPEMEERFVFRLLAQADVFTLWSLYVMAVGFAVNDYPIGSGMSPLLVILCR